MSATRHQPGATPEAHRLQRSRIILDLAVVGLIVAHVRIGGGGVSPPHEVVESVKDVSVWNWLAMAYGCFVFISPWLVNLLTHSRHVIRVVQISAALAVVGYAFKLCTATCWPLYWWLMTVVSSLVAVGMYLVPARLSFTSHV